MSKVSIIIPAYNIASYIDTCLESVCSQTFRDLQILIVDDGSTDATAEKCDAWAARDSRISVIHKENEGVSRARNTGIQNINGEYFMFIDGDDHIEPWSVEKLYQTAKEQNLDVLRANYKILYPDGHIRYKHKRSGLTGPVRTGERLFAEAYQKNLYAATICAGIYRREYVVENNLWFQDNIYHEDELWIPQLLVKAKRANYLNADFYCYVMREGSITHLPDKRKHGRDLMWIAEYLSKLNIVSEASRREWKNLVCGLYFYGINTGKFIQRGDVSHLSKRFVLQNGLTRKNFLRSILFLISFRLYAFANDIYESIGAW